MNNSNYVQILIFQNILIDFLKPFYTQNYFKLNLKDIQILSKHLSIDLMLKNDFYFRHIPNKKMVDIDVQFCYNNKRVSLKIKKKLFLKFLQIPNNNNI